LRSLLVLVLLCLVLDLLTSTGTVTDPDNPPTALPRVPWYGQVDPRIGIEEAYRAPAQAATVPIGWERIPFFWSSLQKTGPDSWNIFAMGAPGTITHQVSLGRQVVGLLISTPAWAAANPVQGPDSPPKGLYLPYNDPHNYWGHFVGLIARRYAGRINDWIIWNEVNIPNGKWKTWGGSVADYVQLLKVAYQAARAANPQAQIILAGDPYWYDHGAFFEQLLHQLVQDPSARAHHLFFDAVNLHLYSRPLETNVVPYNDTVRLYPPGDFRATTDQQASFIMQELALSLAVGVQRVEINRMIDGTDFQAGGEPFGLVRNDFTVRPAFLAYRTAATLFSGVTGGTITENTATGVYRVLLRRPGAILTVLWDQHPQPAAVTIAVPRGTLIFDKFGELVPFTAQHGRVTLALAGATGNTNSANPADYVIGGNPLIVVSLQQH
jgi:hypothetical protein